MIILELLAVLTILQKSSATGNNQIERLLRSNGTNESDELANSKEFMYSIRLSIERIYSMALVKRNVASIGNFPATRHILGNGDADHNKRIQARTALFEELTRVQSEPNAQLEFGHVFQTKQEIDDIQLKITQRADSLRNRGDIYLLAHEHIFGGPDGLRKSNTVSKTVISDRNQKNIVSSRAKLKLLNMIILQKSM